MLSLLVPSSTTRTGRVMTNGRDPNKKIYNIKLYKICLVYLLIDETKNWNLEVLQIFTVKGYQKEGRGSKEVVLRSSDKRYCPTHVDFIELQVIFTSPYCRVASVSGLLCLVTIYMYIYKNCETSERWILTQRVTFRKKLGIR